MKEMLKKICKITEQYDLMPILSLNNMGIYSGQSYASHGALFHLRNEIIKIAYDMLNKENYERAAAALEICHLIDPKDQTVGNDYFYALVLCQKYQDAVMVLDELILGKNPFFEADYRFYSLLLSYFTKLPEIMQKRVLGLEPKNVKILSDDTRFDYESLEDYNLLRRSVYFADFKVAKSVLSNNLAWDYSLESNVARLLVAEASNVDALESETINKLVNTENYSELSNYIASLELKHKISLARVYVKLICDEIIKMKVTQKPLNACEKGTDKMSEAIKNHNYERAIELYQNFGLNTKKYNKNPEVITLLNKAINLRKELITKQEKEAEEQTSKQSEEQSWTTANEFVNLKFQIENYFKSSSDLTRTLILEIKTKSAKKHINEIISFNPALNGLFVSNYVIIHRINTVREDLNISELYDESEHLEQLGFNKEALDIYYRILLNNGLDYNLAIKICICNQNLGYNITAQRFSQLAAILASNDKNSIKVINDIRKKALDKYDNIEDALKLAYYNDDYVGVVHHIIRQIKENYSKNIPIDVTCKICGLKNECLEAMKLIVARNAFINENETLANEIMSEVANSPHLFGIALELYYHLENNQEEITLRRKNNALVKCYKIN